MDSPTQAYRSCAKSISALNCQQNLSLRPSEQGRTVSTKGNHIRKKQFCFLYNRVRYRVREWVQTFPLPPSSHVGNRVDNTEMSDYYSFNQSTIVSVCSRLSSQYSPVNRGTDSWRYFSKRQRTAAEDVQRCVSLGDRRWIDGGSGARPETCPSIRTTTRYFSVQTREPGRGTVLGH